MLGVLCANFKVKFFPWNKIFSPKICRRSFKYSPETELKHTQAEKRNIKYIKICNLNSILSTELRCTKQFFSSLLRFPVCLDKCEINKFIKWHQQSQFRNICNNGDGRRQAGGMREKMGKFISLSLFFAYSENQNVLSQVDVHTHFSVLKCKWNEIVVERWKTTKRATKTNAYPIRYTCIFVVFSAKRYAVAAASQANVNYRNKTSHGDGTGICMQKIFTMTAWHKAQQNDTEAHFYRNKYFVGMRI